MRGEENEAAWPSSEPDVHSLTDNAGEKRVRDRLAPT